MKVDTQKYPVYYHYILEHNDLLEKIGKDFFEKSTFVHIYELARKYALQYRTAPSENDLYSYVRTLDIDEEEKQMKYDSTRIKMLYSRRDELRFYSEESIESEIKFIAEWSSLGEALGSAISEYRMGDDVVTTDNVMMFKDKVLNAVSPRKMLSFVTLDAGEENMDFWNAEDHQRSKVEHYTTGIEFLDTCLKGGFWKGSLHLLVGAPKTGKTMWMCEIAARSVLSGHNTLYLTLETAVGDISSRIARNMLNCTESEYDVSIENPEALASALANFRARRATPLGELHIKRLPASTYTPAQIEDKIKELEEKLGIKFKNVVVDYLQIIKAPTNSDQGLYVGGKKIAEEMRAAATKNDWCMISAVQTTKAQYGTSDIDESHVSESSGYNATVDSMFGIIKDPESPGSSIYRLKCIYDRVADFQGKYKDFVFNREHVHMEEMSGPILCSYEMATYGAARARQESSIRNGNIMSKISQSQSGGNVIRTALASPTQQGDKTIVFGSMSTVNSFHTDEDQQQAKPVQQQPPVVTPTSSVVNIQQQQQSPPPKQTAQYFNNMRTCVAGVGNGVVHNPAYRTYMSMQRIQQQIETSIRIRDDG